MPDIDGPQLQLSLLRPLPVVSTGERVIPFSQKNPLYLLLYLADRGVEQSRSKLASFLFPHGRDDSAKLNQLRQTLHMLNEHLRANGVENLIVSTEETLAIQPASIWIDTHEFSRQAKRLLLASNQNLIRNFLSEAVDTLSLYGDHFLRELQFPNLEWHEARQTDMVRLRHALLEKTIQFQLKQGLIDEATHLAETWRHSLEPGFLPLQYLLAISFKQDMKAKFHEYLAFLQKFEDEDPTFFGPDVERWRMLANGETSFQFTEIGTPPVNAYFSTINRMPDDLRRTDKVPDLVSILTGPTAPSLVGLTGLPGVGKTHFARQSITAIQQQWPQFSIAWVELSSGTHLELLLNEVLSQFQLDHLKTLAYSEKQAAFTQLMQAYRGLIVVDEGMSKRLSHPEFLDAVCEAFKGVQLLLIARHISGNRHYPIELLGFDSALSRQFLIKQNPSLKDTDQDTFEIVAEITGGLPLVLRWITGFTNSKIFLQIKSFNAALTKLRHTRWTRENASERYVYILDWLWQQLMPADKNILFTISMFEPRYGISFEDINAISNRAFLLTGDKLQHKLESLVSLNILQQQAQANQPTRYMLDPITYEYVRDIRSGSFQIEAIRRAYIEHFLHFTVENADDFQRLDEQTNNIIRMFEMVLLENAYLEALPEVTALLSRVYDYFDRSGLYAIAQQLLTAALQLSDLPAVECATLSHQLARAILKHGHRDKAIEQLQNTWAYAQQLKLTDLYAVILRDLGRAFLKQGTYYAAIDALETGKSYAEQQNQALISAQIQANLAVVALEQHQYDAAQRYADQITAIMDGQQDAIRESYDYLDLAQFLQLTLGAAAMNRHRYAEAGEYLQNSLQLAQMLNNPERIARVYLNMAALSYIQSQFEQAAQYLTQGSIVAEYIQHNELMLWFTWNKGAIKVVLEAYQQGEALLYQSLEMAKKLRQGSLIPVIYLWLGILSIRQRDAAIATKFFGYMLRDSPQNVRHVALALYGLGLAERRKNDPAMQDDEEEACRQVRGALDSISLRAIPAITEQELIKAEEYFQVAMSQWHGIRGFHVVRALCAWQAAQMHT